MSSDLKILSYNLHLGRSAFRKASVEERLVETIVREQSDIVMLQELWIPEKAVVRSILDHLQEEWEHHICVPTFRFATGAQGNGLLSAFPIVHWNNRALAESNRQQPRAILHADVEVEGGRKLAVMCTHFGLTHAERLEHARELVEYVHEQVPADRSLLVAGDFNDWPGKLSRYFARELGLSELYQSLHGRHPRTFPSICPFISLDRIYARGMVVKEARVVREAGWFGSSDHLPLSVTVALD